MAEKPFGIIKYYRRSNTMEKNIEAAIIQGFTWRKNSYPDEDQNEDAIKMLIDEQTYLTLLARYKEITRGGGGGAGGDVPYEIDVHITEYDTGKIDANYMKYKFKKSL